MPRDASLSAIPAGRLDLPTLYPKQRAAIYDPARYSFIEASTKAGKTLGCIIWVLEIAWMACAHQNVWWVAPTYQQAKIAFDRILAGLRVTRGIVVNRSDLSILLPSRAMIWFKSGDKPDSLYGEDVIAAVIDEASRVKEESWTAVRSTLTATRGRVRCIGNVKGRRNWFYRLARKAEAGAPNMAYHKLTADDAVRGGIFSRDEIEDARSVLPDAVFRELYYAEPSDDQGNPFGFKAIRDATIDYAPAGGIEAWGVDLAKSHDWTVASGLTIAGELARCERWQSPWETTISRLNLLLQAPAAVDSTGVGDPIVERLQKAHPGRIESFKFTQPSKQQLMEGLAVAIQQREVLIPRTEVVTLSELESFEYQYTRTGVRYSAPEGEFDDAVCALALAVHRLKSRPVFAFAGVNKRSVA